MVLARLAGGLGNQLFQYAAAKNFSLRNNMPLLLDITFFEIEKLRAFTLTSFDIKHIDIYQVDQGARLFSVYHMPHLTFDPKFFNKYEGNIHIKGFWQSEKYFKEIKTLLIEEFSIKKSLIKHLLPAAEVLKQEESVCVHVRRGDYQYRRHLDRYGFLTPEYFIKACQLVSQKRPYSKFYFFSDDIEWVKENIKINQWHEYISNHVTKSDIEDFFLMKACKHSIISNSTFSWWTAWLNTNADQIVVAPEKWIAGDINTSDVVPESWIKL